MGYPAKDRRFHGWLLRLADWGHHLLPQNEMLERGNYK
jgi:hypothetical protein